MSELVDRQAAIDVVSERCGICIQRIVDLPSAQPEQRWIPCSERLPDKNGDYIVTDTAGGLAEVHETYYIKSDFDVCPWGLGHVVAWMPMPAPYTEVQND